MKRYGIDSDGYTRQDRDGEWVKYEDAKGIAAEAKDCLAFSVWLISKHLTISRFVSKDELSEYIQRQFEIFKRESEN